jgi:hypothetical protein
MIDNMIFFVSNDVYNMGELGNRYVTSVLLVHTIFNDFQGS